MNGYVIIDCKGLELTSQTKQTITGIYNRVRDAYNTGKPCICYNCLWEDDVMSPFNVMINPRSSGNYIATASTLQIEIDDEDGIEITNMISE